MYKYSPLEVQLENWRFGRSVDLVVVDQAIDSELSGRIDLIQVTARSDPRAAFTQLVTLTNFLSTSGGLRGSIVEKLAEQVAKLRDALAEIAKGLRAESFDIGVSFTGLSVSMSFKVQRP